MARIGWLHLTDLHYREPHAGLDAQAWLWPGVRQQFFEDLTRLHDKAGPWEVVFFTGDLTQRGSEAEFRALDEALHQVWEHLRKLGSSPILLPVPGNHDLSRPPARSPVMKALRSWHEDEEIREDFWQASTNLYRTAIDDAFQGYSRWWNAQPAGSIASLRRGLLPGDFSVTIESAGLRLGVVGLNSAFLQLTADEYLERLDLDPRQVHATCGDVIDWVDDHHVAILLTHHPVDWLHPRVRHEFAAEIAPAGRFLVHMFGHMHEPTAHSLRRRKKLTSPGSSTHRLSNL